MTDAIAAAALTLEPAIGSAVLFWPVAEADRAMAVDDQPCAALVVYVDPDDTSDVTLAVFGHDGTQYTRGATVLQPGDEAPAGESYASWPADPTEEARRGR